MAPLSTLVSSLLIPTATRMTAVQSATASPNVPNLYVPDIKARNAVIFGTFSTLLTTVGIIVAGATLRIAYQTRHGGHDQNLENMGTDGAEMDNMSEGRSLSRLSTAETSVE